MKRFFIIFGFLLGIHAAVWAQAADSTLTVSLNRANAMYQQGQYSDAAKLYETMLSRGVSAELYYNLGNSYFKADEIGLAILNYERALRLNPHFDDAVYNRQIAENKIVDNVNSAPPFFVKRWVNKLTNIATSDQWAYTALLFFVIGLTALLLFFFADTRRRRKLAFYAAILFSVFFICALFFSGVRKEQFVRHNSAIVLSGAVTAKSAPDASGTDLFQLHEGTKVDVRSTLGTWTEISLENGAVGWIEEKAIARI